MPDISSQKESLRPLSGIETHMANSHLTQRGTSQITTLLHISGFIDPIILKNAYTQLCSNEPILTATLEKENDAWLLVKNNNQNITTDDPAFSYETSNAPLIASDALLEDEMHKTLDPQRNLTRLRLISSEKKDDHILCLTQHHGASDAFTAKRILSRLLYQIAPQTPHASLTRKTIRKERHTSRLFSYPKLKQEIQENSTFSPIYKDFPDALKYLTAHNKPIKENAAATSICTLIFDNSFLSPLNTLAKNNHISLNSLLSIILGHSVRELLHLSHLPTLTAVSNRLHHEKMGCFIDVAPITLEEPDLLNAARAFHDKMQKFKNNLPQNPTPFPLKALSKIMPLSQDKAITLCQGVGFTNSGRIEKIPCPKTIKILAYRSVTKRDWGDMFPVFHFSFFNQELFISIASPTLFLDKAQEARLVNYIYKTMIRLITPLQDESHQ